MQTMTLKKISANSWIMAVFGKNMENVCKWVDIKLMRMADEKKVLKYIAKPTYAHHTIFFNEDLVGIQNHRAKVYLNKPIYIGMCILELPKYLMCDFYYNRLKKFYGDNIQLLYTDRLCHYSCSDG